MKTLTKALFVLVATSAVSVGANAALFQNADGMTGQPYVGIKAGVYNVSPANSKIKNDNDNPAAYGIVAGYQFDPNWGVEGEYVTTEKGDMNVKTTLDKVPVYTTTTVPAVTDASGNITTPATTTTTTAYESQDVTVHGKLKGETIGLYGTYKYDFPNTAIYVKGKLGIAQNKFKNEFPRFTVVNSKNQTIPVSGTDNDYKESGLAGGVGLGYNVTPAVSVEAEYSVLPKVEDSDSDLITLGAKVKF